VQRQKPQTQLLIGRTDRIRATPPPFHRALPSHERSSACGVARGRRCRDPVPPGLHHLPCPHCRCAIQDFFSILTLFNKYLRNESSQFF
jgi:hypothetical protein